MSSSGKANDSGLLDQLPQDLDWAGLVKEMKQVQDRVEEAVGGMAPAAPMASAMPLAEEAPVAPVGLLDDSPRGPRDAPMEEMLLGLPPDEHSGMGEKGALAEAPAPTAAPAVAVAIAPVVELKIPEAAAPVAAAPISGAAPAFEAPEIPKLSATARAVTFPLSGSVAAAQESALSLAVVGALKLRLELTRQSQTVQIHVEEDALRVEVSGGMQFRIPLNQAA